jgi:hypothetical protein
VAHAVADAGVSARNVFQAVGDHRAGGIDVNRFFDSFSDLSMLVPVDSALVEAALDNPDRTASELLLLYFACLTSDSDGAAVEDAPERIALAISDMADDGDEEAIMAMIAISALTDDDAPVADVIVGVAMLNTVASRPLLRSVISGDLDNETVAGALSVFNMLSNELLGAAIDLDDIDDLDLDDIDFSEWASQRGISEIYPDFDGEPNDR